MRAAIGGPTEFYKIHGVYMARNAHMREKRKKWKMKNDLDRCVIADDGFSFAAPEVAYITANGANARAIASYLTFNTLRRWHQQRWLPRLCSV